MKVRHSPFLTCTGSLPETSPRRRADIDDVETALDLVKDKFLDKTSANSKQSIYVQRTCALDTDQIKEMFSTVRTNLQRFKA